MNKKTQILELKYPLHHYQDAAKFSMQAHHGIVAIQLENCVDVINLSQASLLHGSDVSLSTTSRITSHALSDNTLDQTLSIALSSGVGNLAVFEIQGGQCKCTTELHHLTLKGLIREHQKNSKEALVNECRILSFTGGKLTVLVGSQLIVQLLVNETKPWEIVYTIDCPSKVLDSSVSGNILSVLDSDHSILFYDMVSSNFLAVVQREKNRHWNSCRLTKDYLHMILQNENGEIYCCNLDVYFNENSLLLNRDHSTPHKKSSSDTNHWFDKLQFSGKGQHQAAVRRFKSTKSFHKVSLNGDSLSYQCSEDHVSVVSLHKGSMILTSYDLVSGNTESLELGRDECVILSDIETIPHLILSGEKVFAVTAAHFRKHYSQADIKSGLLKSMSSKNGWECEAPPTIEKLTAAVQNRDYNSVMDFIKSRNTFIDDVMASPPVGNREDLEQMCKLLNTAATTYIAHSTTNKFAVQITEAIITFLQEQTRRGMVMLREMLMSEEVEKRELLESLLEKLSDHVIGFNEILKSKSKKSATPSKKTIKKQESKKVLMAKELPALTKDIIKKWNSQSTKELVGDGILMGDISLLQGYFRLHNREDEASWDYIVKIGLQCVLDELEMRNWPTACQMLKNMGFGVFTKLSQIAMYTTDSNLRKYLVEELKSEGEFTESDQQAIEFAAEIDQLYPCESFQQTLVTGRSGTYSNFPTSDVFNLGKLCGEIGVISPDTVKSRWCSHYMLDWVNYWIPYRHDLFIDRIIHDEERQEELKQVPAHSLWSYLCRHNSIEELLLWVDVQYNKTEKKHEYQNHTITTNMIDACCSLLPLSSKITVLDKLAVHGVLDSETQSTVQGRFRSLCRTGLLHDRTQSEKLITLEEFISHCITNSLLEVLFHHFEIWGVEEKELKGLHSKLSGKDYLLLIMLYSFHKLSSSTDDPELILEASLASSRYLTRNPYLTWSELMDKQLTDVALCGVMYHNPILENSSISLPQDKIALYKEHALFRHLLDNEGGTSNPDLITLYTLLKKWGITSGDRLFAFQKNSPDTEGFVKSDDILTAMPHFANDMMVERYGYEEKLTFLYYLKEARPCFAYIVFLSDEITANNGSTISGSRMNLAVSQTHYLAVKFYDKLEIGAACVAFLELIQEETDKLRLLINTAQIIHKGRLLEQPGAEVKVLHYQIESMILPLIFGKKKTIRIVYDELISATEACIEAKGIIRTSIEAGMKWRSAIDYSRQYSLPLPTKFLDYCSSENKWLSFLVYSQIFGYERLQLLSAVNSFSDDSKREHLQCVLDSNNSVKLPASPTAEMKQQNKREQIYFKMGVGLPAKQKSNPALISSSEDETRRNMKEKQILNERQSSPKLNSMTSSQTTDVGGLPLEHVPNDIFAVLFMTSNHPGSWRQLNVYAVLLENPVLAVLAACHKESDALECLTSWLMAWLPDGSRLGKECMDTDTGQYISRATAVDVIRHVSDSHKYLLLRTALNIFIKNCPLILLIDALELVTKQDFIGAQRKLAQFKSTMNQLFRQSQGSSASVGGDNFTTEELSTSSLHIIQTSSTWLDSFLCEKFLNLLDGASLFTVFKHQNMNFSHAHSVYKVVYEHRLDDIDRSRLVSQNCLDEAKNVLKILEDRKQFGVARELSVACGLDTGLVTVQELLHDTEQAKYQTNWQKNSNHADFWAICNEKCINLDLDPRKCSSFFESQAGLSSSQEDKVILSQYALSWIKQHPAANETGDIRRLQKLVWENKINHLRQQKVEDEYRQLPSQSAAYPKRPEVSISVDKTQFLLLDYKYDEMMSMKNKSGSREINMAVSTLIGELLDEFKIDEACQLSTEYRCSTQDLAIILVCIGLAAKRLQTEELDPRIKAIFAKHEVRKRRSSSLSQGYLLAMSSVEDFAAMSKAPTVRDDSTLDVMEKLAHQCQHGSMACDKIVCCYVIAMALGQSYKETILQSEYSLLKQLLSSQVEDKFKLTLEYINTCSLSDSDVASFLASNITNTLRAVVGLDHTAIGSLGDGATSTSTHECERIGREYKQLIQLFSDQTVFGNALLEQANNITINVDEPEAESKLAMKVELLILAHDAHTCAYDMEGISSVLRACRACSVQMNDVSTYSLMIHLLTGIGRFSEMTYIFDTLKQNHRFELLFRKGMPKENKLRLAVLDYLRRFCPGDNDIYRVVSSHFAMYREIAQLLEESAMKKLNQLNVSAARNSDLLTSSLTDIQKNLTDAAEIYMEGQCLRHAQNCVKQARLVCLQIHLIPAGIQVINLEANLVRSFIETHEKFHEVFIVSEAYNKSFWAIALCNNVLVRGDMKYLTDYKKSLLLTTSLITEIVQRFQIKTEVVRTQHINNNLRRLLSYCKDVVVRYKLARALDLKDVTNELLTTQNGLLGAVIKDSYGSNLKPTK